VAATPDHTLEGPAGPVRLIEALDRRRRLIVHDHTWPPGERRQNGGCTSLANQFARLDFLEPYVARFVTATQGRSTRHSITSVGWATG